MQMLKRSNSNPFKRESSGTPIHNRTESNLQYTISPPHSRVLPNNTENPKSIIERLLKGDNLYSLKKISSRVQLRNRKNILGDTEGRIFSQVIGLVGEIDQLRADIQTTQIQIRQLSITRPDIAERVRFHGFEQKMTEQQCAQVEQENARLQAIIRETEESQVGRLEDVLRIQRQKYEDLKQQLAEDKPIDSEDLEERTKALKADIQALQAQRGKKMQLKAQNEALRQSTLAGLYKSKQLAEQYRELQQYLQSDQLHKQEFMVELQSWKAEYNRLKEENEALKGKLMKKERSESKENLNNNVLQQNKGGNRMLELQSQIKKQKNDRNDRLSQYSSLIKRMQSLKR